MIYNILSKSFRKYFFEYICCLYVRLASRLRMTVSNTSEELNATNETQEMVFSEEEKRRLAAYFDTLIEMDREQYDKPTSKDLKQVQ